MSTQIQIRRDTTANWESANPVMAEGELGYDLTVENFKVGDGTSAWMDLEYSGGGDDLWVASEPDQFGQRIAKFSDQLDNPDDARNFFIRYYTDPEQGTKSNSLINTEKLWANKIEAKDIAATDSVTSDEVKAEAVEAVSSVALDQTVLGGITVGQSDGSTSYTEEQEAEAKAGLSALTVWKQGLPRPQVTVSIEKNGNITSKGVVQANDYLDADGNSIVSIDWFDESDHQPEVSAIKLSSNYKTGDWGADNFAAYGGAVVSGLAADENIATCSTMVYAFPNGLTTAYRQYAYDLDGENNANIYGEGVWAVWEEPNPLSSDFNVRIWGGHPSRKRPGIGAPFGMCEFYQGHFEEVRASAYQDKDGNAMMSISDVIDGFSAIQQAVSDEVTVEGLRDSIANAVGGFIERLEAKQAEVAEMVRKSAEELKELKA